MRWGAIKEFLADAWRDLPYDFGTVLRIDCRGRVEPGFQIGRRPLQ